jgi:hypothetical protein
LYITKHFDGAIIASASVCGGRRIAFGGIVLSITMRIVGWKSVHDADDDTLKQKRRERWLGIKTRKSQGFSTSTKKRIYLIRSDKFAKFNNTTDAVWSIRPSLSIASDALNGIYAHHFQRNDIAKQWTNKRPPRKIGTICCILKNLFRGQMISFP